MKTIINLFKELFYKFPWHFIFLIGIVFFQALTNALSVIAIAPITDFLLEKDTQNVTFITKYLESITISLGFNLNLLFAFIFFGVIVLTGGLLSVLSHFSLLRIKYDVVKKLLTDTVSKFLDSSFIFFSQGDSGKLLNTFQKETDKVGDTFGHMAKFIANSLQVFIFLSVPLTLSPKFTLIFLLITFLISTPLLLLSRWVYRFGKQTTETGNYNTGVIYEIITGAKLILSYGVQKPTVKKFEDSFEQHSKAAIKSQALSGGISLLFVPAGTIAALIVVYLAVENNLPLGEVIMVLFAFTRLLPLLAALLEARAGIGGFFPAYEQIQNLEEIAERHREPQGDIMFESLQTALELKNVTFSYSEKKKPALNKVNITIERGRFTALVGSSGSGKTSTLDLMLGLFHPVSGKILIDGIELRKFNLNSIRKKVGYVPQDPLLFNSSIKENLLWSLPEAKEEEIWDACRIANAEAFIKLLPERMETVLGDRGVRLSGGQRQRIALARAIIRKPEILFLDEATSSLDAESEDLIQKSINTLSGQTTIVVIAHRLSTIKNADFVYVLELGEVKESGNYKKLKNNPQSLLNKMIKKQGM